MAAEARKTAVICGAVLCCLHAFSAAAHGAADSTPAAELFPLRDVRLLAGPLKDQQELNHAYLLKLEPDRLLSWFRRGAGLDPKAPPYRGWESESPQLPGHILGFYMSGASMMLQSTGDPVLRDRLNYIVDQLDEVQNANGSGYMLAVPEGKRIFADIAKGNIRIDGLPWTGYQINGNFEPTYTLNKLTLGLYQVYLATGNEKAKNVLIRCADWFGNDVLDKLNDSQVQTLLDCEHGSLNESYAQVYELTGNPKYLTWARRLCHERMLAPLAKGHGEFLNQYHANTQIPKFTGFEAVYGFNHETRLDEAAVNFWNEVVHHRTWVIGGNSADEHFYDPKNAVQAMNALAGPESCNTVNMLRLTEAVFRQHPSGELMDYYERALFNHLLSAHDPERGMCAYYTSMRPGAYRVYGDEFDSMWCCTGTGLEAPGKYGQMIFSHPIGPDAGPATLDVNLFASAQSNWPQQKCVVRQTTQFPFEPGTTLTMNSTDPAATLKLRVRHPAWVPDGAMKITMDGREVPVHSRRGEYAEVTGAWKPGQKVHVDLPMHLGTETVPDNDQYVAILYGPIVLSGALGRDGLTKSDFWQIGTTVGAKPASQAHVPTLVCDPQGSITDKLEPVAGKPLTFRAPGLMQPDDVELIPFFQNHFQRYVIYWHRMTPAQWQAERVREQASVNAQRDLDAATIDRILIGNADSEREHHLQGARTNTGTGAYGLFPDKAWRDAGDGGYFSYELKVEPAHPCQLYCLFWGRERGPRTFDILVDGTVLATKSLGDAGQDDFLPGRLPIPARLIEGKQKLTIRFQAHPGNTAGGLFDLRTIREPAPSSH